MNDSVMSKAFFSLSHTILCILLLIALAASALICFRSPEPKIKLKEVFSISAEKENTIQIACVGNSDLYSGFSPLDLWNEYGYTSTVCASAQQTIEESHRLLKKLFKSQQPQFVIIETDMLYDNNPEIKNFCRNSKSLNNIFAKINPEYLRQDISSLTSILIKKSYKHYHGYRYSSKVCKIDFAQYMNITDAAEKITKENAENMDNLIEYCNENNTKVIFITMPSISSWNYERHNAVSEYATAKNIDYIDFNLIYSEIGIDPSICYRDNGNHLNYYGAKAVTAYIGNFLNNTYSLMSFKDNQYFDYWNEDYKRFQRNIT